MAINNLKSPIPNSEIKERYVFIPTEEFTKKFLENCIVSEVSYLYPYDSESYEDSTTTTIFKKCNDEYTLTVKTADGDIINTGFTTIVREVKISKEEYEAFTKKLFKIKFRHYKDENGYEFKMFGDPDNKHQIKIFVEKEFDRRVTFADRIKMSSYISKLGHDIYFS